MEGFPCILCKDDGGIPIYSLCNGSFPFSVALSGMNLIFKIKIVKEGFLCILFENDGGIPTIYFIFLRKVIERLLLFSSYPSVKMIEGSLQFSLYCLINVRGIPTIL